MTSVGVLGKAFHDPSSDPEKDAGNSQQEYFENSNTAGDSAKTWTGY